MIPLYLIFYTCADILFCHQSEGETHQQALPEVCGPRPGDSLLGGEGETERSSLLLLLCGPALHCSDGGAHRPLVSTYSRLLTLLLHNLAKMWFELFSG